jgi:hypothetical protein
VGERWRLRCGSGHHAQSEEQDVAETTVRVVVPTPNPSQPLRYASWGEGNRNAVLLTNQTMDHMQVALVLALNGRSGTCARGW